MPANDSKSSDLTAMSEEWRMRAEELYTIADTMRDPQAKQSLIKQADEWLRMSQRVEQHATKEH